MALKFYNLRFKLIGLKGFIFKNSKCVPSIAYNRCNQDKYFHSVSQKNIRLMKETSFVGWKNHIHLQSSCHAPKTVSFLLSDIGEGIVEVEVKDWYIKQGNKVSQFDPICEVQSDKASVTITSRYDGVIEKLNYDIGAVAKVGSSLYEVQLEDDQSQGNVINDDSSWKVTEQLSLTIEDKVDLVNKVLATPAVRRIAKENNVNSSFEIWSYIHKDHEGFLNLKETSFCRKDLLSAARVFTTSCRTFSSQKVSFLPIYTKLDYNMWDDRWELHYGQPIFMGPSPIRQHQRIGRDLIIFLQNQITNHGKCGDCQVLYKLDWNVSENDSKKLKDLKSHKIESPEDTDKKSKKKLHQQKEPKVDFIYKPDIVIVCHDDKDSAYITKAPKLIIEVLSDSTAAFDKGEKKDSYEKLGVKYLVLIDPISLNYGLFKNRAKGYKKVNLKYLQLHENCRILFPKHLLNKNTL